MSNKTRELPMYPIGGLVTVQDLEFFELKAQCDNAWKELREIREAIGANPEESTADEVRRLVLEKSKIRHAALELHGVIEEHRAMPSKGIAEEMYKIADRYIGRIKS